MRFMLQLRLQFAQFACYQDIAIRNEYQPPLGIRS